MKRFILPSTLVVAVMLVAGCSEAPSPVQPGEPLFGTKSGGSSNLSASFHLPNTGSSILGDGKGADGSTAADFSVYKDGQCGVTATIFSGGDAHLQTNNPKHKDRRCGPRPLKAIYEGGTDDAPGIINVKGAGLLDPNGGTAVLQMGVRIENSPCYRLKYSTLVSRNGAQWTVKNNGDTALCETSGMNVRVGDFSFTITTP